MPEIAEVARIVHHLKKSLVGKTLSVVKAQDDANVYGKVGTSAAEFEKALTGKKVLEAGQQGKYFWLIMSSPPHPVFHFGMTGWMHIRGGTTTHYRPKETDPDVPEEWPPKYWKFRVETDSNPKVEAAFTDSRRFARIRLVDCDAKEIRNTTPLKENGPDPVIDKDILTAEWLEEKMKKRHVPVKAFMLDQANISGIGNWVGDEIMYHAKLHPEQYCDTFSPTQIDQLHTSMLHVCQTAVDLLADSNQFPEEWLFKHRWGKGKKDAPTALPNGDKITFLTVGGRTSCVVPSVQKKTGPVAGDVKKEDAQGMEDDGEVESKKGVKANASKKRKSVLKEEDESEDVPPLKKKAAASKKAKAVKVEIQRDVAPKTKRGATKKSKSQVVKAESEEDESSAEVEGKKPKGQNKSAGTKKEVKDDNPAEGRRRSGRVSKV